MRNGESTNMLETKKDQLPADPERGVLRKLRSALKDRMMLMAFTGFITLGGPIGESYADQLKIAKHDKGVPHFVMAVPFNTLADSYLCKFVIAEYSRWCPLRHDKRSQRTIPFIFFFFFILSTSPQRVLSY